MRVTAIHPFGFWFAEHDAGEPKRPVREWEWVPSGSAERLDAEASLPGTTGTGPDARGDEVRDES